MISRNFEKNNIYINRWLMGLVTNKSAIETPLSSMGLQVISRYDTLHDGLNTDISHQKTLVRRYGFSRFSTAQFGSSDYPLNFFSFKQSGTGTLYSMVDTPTMVAKFTGTAITSLYTKGTTAQTSFVKVGDTLYMCDGTNLKKWDGTTVTKWGIAAPGSAPALGFGSGNGLSIPANTPFSTATTGGTLAPGTYYYRVAATNGGGSTGASLETSIVVPSGTSTNTVTVKWGLVTGATGYKVYGRTSGTEQLMATISSGATTTWVDTGSVTPSGALPGDLLTTSNGGYQYVFVYKNSSTGHVSSASPFSASTGNLDDQYVTVTGASSADTQVDKVDIYRTADGGGTYYWLAEVNNGGTWTYTDTSPDTSLNNFIVAPVAGINDPPPAGASLAVFHMGRMWIANGRYLYFGAGSDTTVGVPEEAFPGANVFTLDGNITAMCSTTQGLAVWTQADMYVVTGVDLPSFVAQKWQSNLGVMSQNSVCQDGDLFYMFTSQKQLFQFSSGGLGEVGFAIQDKLAAFTPSSVYMALHRAGVDEGLFISNGTDSFYRYSISMQCWSPVAMPVGGVKCLKSIELTTGNYRLMLGRATGAGYILERDTATFTDDGQAYSANATVGTITLAPPGSLAQFDHIYMETMPVGTYPAVSVLLNEITGTFTQVGVSATGADQLVNDPAMLPASTSIWMKRHDRASAQAPLANAVRLMQVKITFSAESAYNEVLGMGIY